MYHALAFERNNVIACFQVKDGPSRSPLGDGHERRGHSYFNGKDGEKIA
jgi:hypothetical protein